MKFHLRLFSFAACISSLLIVGCGDKDPSTVKRTMLFTSDPAFYENNPDANDPCKYFDGPSTSPETKAKYVDVAFEIIDATGDGLEDMIDEQRFEDGVDFNGGDPNLLKVIFPAPGAGTWLLTVTVFGYPSEDCCPPKYPGGPVGFPIWEIIWPVQSTSGTTDVSHEQSTYGQPAQFVNCVYLLD